MIKGQRINLKKQVKLTEFFLINLKENYDNFGHAAFENGGSGRGGFGGFGGFNGSDFSDIFEDFFGDFGGGRRNNRRNNNNRGSDLRYDLSITLEEAYTGKKQNIQFSSSDKCTTCKEMAQSLVQVQIDVLTVGETVGSDLIKVSSQFNKLVLNVLAVGKKLLIHVLNAMVKETNKLQKKSL